MEEEKKKYEEERTMQIRKTSILNHVENLSRGLLSSTQVKIRRAGGYPPLQSFGWGKILTRKFHHLPPGFADRFNVESLLPYGEIFLGKGDKNENRRNKQNI